MNYQKNNNIKLCISTIITLLIIFFSNNEFINFDYKINKYSIYPIGSFMIEKGVFDDFLNSIEISVLLPDSKSSFIITPFSIIILKHLKNYNKPYIFLYVYLVISIVIMIISLKILKINYLYRIVYLISYPMLFAISRGNPFLLSFSLFFLGFSVYYRQINVRNNITNILITLSLLIHPGCFLMIASFSNNFYKKNNNNIKIIAIMYTISNIIIILLLSNFDFKNYICFIYSYMSSLNMYKNEYILKNSGMLFNNSLFGLFKFLVYFIEINFHSSPISTKTFYFLNNLISLVIIYFIIVKNKIIFIDKIIIFAILTVLTPSVSADYKLLILIYPLIYINLNINKLNLDCEKILYSKIYFIILCIIIPKHLIFFYNDSGFMATIQTLVNPLLCLFILYLIYKKRRNQSRNSPQIN